MSQNDEIATQTQYCCARCGQLLGLLLDDGRLEVAVDGVAIVRLIEGVMDCVFCGRRHGFSRAEEAPGPEEVPLFIEKHYPNHDSS